MVSVDVGKINLKHILESGQCFRWTQKTDNIFNFVIGNNIIECQIDNKGLLMVESNSEIRETDVKNYFDTSTDYSFIKDCADKNDEYLQNAIQKFGDIVILRQDLWEVIISFIISQRKSIPAIKTCIKKLSTFFGKEIKNFAQIEYSFPSPEDIQMASLNELEQCGVGYRAKYLKAAAEWFLTTPKNQISIDSVKEIYGVGEKVKNCIGLFGLHDLSCCPIDVWMQRIIDNRYKGKIPDWMHSEFAGVYQQYVFMYERSLRTKSRKEVD